MSDTKLRICFARFLACGGYSVPPGRAMCALRSARTLIAFEEAERQWLVKIEAEYDTQSTIDWGGEPEAYVDGNGRRVSAKLALKEHLEIEKRMGVWIVSSYVKRGEEWDVADSIGGCVYDNPCSAFENCYVVDLMAEALDQLEVVREEGMMIS